jgi:hypothetical protein
LAQNGATATVVRAVTEKPAAAAAPAKEKTTAQTDATGLLAACMSVSNYAGSGRLRDSSITAVLLSRGSSRYFSPRIQNQCMRACERSKLTPMVIFSSILRVLP